MSGLKYCPYCGSQLAPGDRFCGDCGYDTQGQAMSNIDTIRPVSPLNQTGAPDSVPPSGSKQAYPLKDSQNKKALLILISLLAVVFLAGGGLYWWLSRGDDPVPGANLPLAGENAIPEAPVVEVPGQAKEHTPDLSRASTYLSEAGLKCTFYVNYPDGTAGIVDRISARVVPNEAVRVSEVEVGVEQGEDFGFAFHYVERADGTYYIFDDTPMEITPVLKNNMTVGQTWEYENEYGKITWKVLDMGIDLKLDFTTIADCLVIEEDNPVFGYKNITYYAPGMGIVMVKSGEGGADITRLTAYSRIDQGEAANIVKKWAFNYGDIKDDRTQE